MHDAAFRAHEPRVFAERTDKIEFEFKRRPCLAFSDCGKDRAAEGGIAYDISFFLDAFSRSVGFTLILVLGLMAVTHHYKPTIAVEIGVFGLAIVAFVVAFAVHGLGNRRRVRREETPDPEQVAVAG